MPRQPRTSSTLSWVRRQTIRRQVNKTNTWVKHLFIINVSCIVSESNKSGYPICRRILREGCGKKRQDLGMSESFRRSVVTHNHDVQEGDGCLKVPLVIEVDVKVDTNVFLGPPEIIIPRSVFAISIE